MRKIISSCFNKVDEEYKEYLDQLIVENATFKTKKIKLLMDKEVDFINFMLNSFNNSKQFPSKELFEIEFPESASHFEGIPELALDDFRVYMCNLINKRTNSRVAEKIKDLNNVIKENGFTEELMDEMEEFKKLSEKNKTKNVNINFDFNTVYLEKLDKPIGMTSCIETVDAKIGAINAGTLTTIAGFTSHFKTTWAVNIAYVNTYTKNFNLVYISLETPKEDVYFNIYCRHSFNAGFVAYPFISHEKIRMCQISQEEFNYLNDFVIADLHSPSIDIDGNESERGKLIVLDESDFNTMSFTDIYNVLEDIDIQLGGNLDGFIVDYAQLCKFTESAKGMDDNRIINSYISFFRRLTQKFRGGKHRKQLIGIILSQINRTNWLKASKKGGVYDLTCLADANELERGSYRVMTIYTDEDKKVNRSAQVQILKNRGGPTMYEPRVVFADGEAYAFGEENTDTMGKTFGGDILGSGENLGMVFNDFDNSKFGDFDKLI